MHQNYIGNIYTVRCESALATIITTMAKACQASHPSLYLTICQEAFNEEANQIANKSTWYKWITRR